MVIDGLESQTEWQIDILNTPPLSCTILPSKALSIWSAVGCGILWNNVYMVITIPGVQNPHCSPWDFTKLFCNNSLKGMFFCFEEFNICDREHCRPIFVFRLIKQILKISLIQIKHDLTWEHPLTEKRMHLHLCACPKPRPGFQRFSIVWWFSQSIQVSYKNKTECHGITDILLTVVCLHIIN